MFALTVTVWLFPHTAHAQLRLQPYASGFSLPVGFVQDPTDPSVHYIVEQTGSIQVVRNGVPSTTPFLNLMGVVGCCGERGLLGLAFSPDYAISGRLFVNFTNTDGHTVVARFKRSATDPLVADPASRFDLRWASLGDLPFIPHDPPFGNHNGGDLAFGPDGYLYIGMGDGGSGNDPLNRAQSRDTLLGKMLRIDVTVPDTDGHGYRVPADNPFVTAAGTLPEIWDFGLRNPWRFSFDLGDGGTGDLVIADVGQNNREEINWEPAGRGGRNYGWRILEGTRTNVTTAPPAFSPLINPIHEYDHTVGFSITGGFTYRGVGEAAYRGRYFFADFGTGRIWSIAVSIAPGTGEAALVHAIEHTAELGGAGAIGNVSSFGRDANGDLYVVRYAGSVSKLVVPQEPVPVYTAVAIDLNADQYDDAFLYDKATGAWIKAINNRAGGFTATAGQWSSGWDIHPMDINRDGLMDLFVHNPALGAWVKVYSVGNGSFTYENGVWFWPGFQFHPMDLNGDGKSDLFGYNPGTGLWMQLFLDGRGTFAGYLLGQWSPGWQLSSLDLDHDGVTDLFAYIPNRGVWVKILNRFNGAFRYEPGQWSAGWKVDQTDLDGDGFQDLFVYSAATGVMVRVLIGAGGNFSYDVAQWWSNLILVPIQLNGDALMDFLLYNPTNGAFAQAFSTIAGGFIYTGGACRPG
jgi:glucose/arabinose dehydrogenase